MGEALRLQFHHNVIEHLGLRLYQNKPDKVVCELVSNSWDADAEHVRVDLAVGGDGGALSLAVLDDGVGMDRNTLQAAFLTIAAPRRKGQNEPARSNGGRLLMGRKGIGKLAPFGICRIVNVITGSAEEGFTWIKLDLRRIEQASPAPGASELGRYEPDEIAAGVSLEELRLIDVFPDIRDRYVALVEGSSRRSGTAIILSDISERVRLTSLSFRRAIATRFTVTLARHDFDVQVDGRPITEQEALPTFEYRIPASGTRDDLVGELPVKFWVGFTEKPIPKRDESGIGVFAHGKIGQERPFYFDLTGNDLYLPYVYGVVEADWLDDFAEDLISTDRSSINWDHPKAALLKEWGQKSLRRWINEYQGVRRAREEEDNARAVEEDVGTGALPRLTRTEQRSLVTLLSEVSPRLPPDQESRSAVVSALASAWLHKPARAMIQSLWEGLRSDNIDASAFMKTLDAIREWSVPEALSLSVTFAQRAFALTVLYELIHLGKEPDLQRLVETFPWIVGPESEYLTANESLKTVTMKAQERGFFARDDDHVPIKSSIKPDFVFLTDATEKTILVAELKSPQEELTIDNREQLSSYLTFLEAKYPDAKRKGILIGNAPHGFSPRRDDIEVRPWNQVFLMARSSYTTILASMLSGYAEDPNDPRIRDVQVFGGTAVWELLKGISAHDEVLEQLMNAREREGVFKSPSLVLPGNAVMPAISAPKNPDSD